MPIIIVKDYLYEGNHILGVPYDIKDGKQSWILDDGDVYTEELLKQNDYQFRIFDSNDVCKAMRVEHWTEK